MSDSTRPTPEQSNEARVEQLEQRVAELEAQFSRLVVLVKLHEMQTKLQEGFRRTTETLDSKIRSGQQ